MLKHLVERMTAAPLVGVDVGSATLKVVGLAASPDGRVVLRHGAVAPVDHDRAGALKRLCREAGIAGAQAAVGVAAPQVVVKPFAFPVMPRKELHNAIQLEAEQAILNGHSPKEMAIDWHFLASSKGSVRGLLAVVPKTLIAARLDAVKAAGLKPAVVDVEGLALWNAYWTLVGSREPAPATVLLVNVGARTTNVVIAKGPDELILVRDFELGALALGNAQESDWVAEVRDSLGYARSAGGLRTLNRVVVTGGGSPADVMRALKAALPFPAELWNPLRQIARDAQSPSFDEAVGPSLAVSVGLALRQPS